MTHTRKGHTSIDRKRTRLTVSSLLCLLSLLFSTTPLLALSSDAKQPLRVTAQSVQINRKTGISVYQGNVRATQGSTLLTGDLVYVFNNKQKKITEIISIGNHKQLAHYQTIPTAKQSPFDAWAVTIKYFPEAGLALLIKQARAEQSPNVIQSPLIAYNVKKQIITSVASPNQQNSILIHPDQLPKT